MNILTTILLLGLTFCTGYTPPKDYIAPRKHLIRLAKTMMERYQVGEVVEEEHDTSTTNVLIVTHRSLVVEFEPGSIEEMLEHHLGRVPRHHQTNKWKTVLSQLPPQLCDIMGVNCTSTIHTKEILETKVQMAGYDEKMSIFGLPDVCLLSSGYCLGSCNWVITPISEKVVHLSICSTRTTHTKAMDQTSIRMADPIISDVCLKVRETLKAPGYLLVFSYPSRIIYDLYKFLSIQRDTELWGSSPNNLVTEPSFIHQLVLAFYQPLTMETYHFSRKLIIVAEPTTTTPILYLGNVSTKRMVSQTAEGVDARVEEDMIENNVAICSAEKAEVGSSVCFSTRVLVDLGSGMESLSSVRHSSPRCPSTLTIPSPINVTQFANASSKMVGDGVNLVPQVTLFHLHFHV